MRSLALLALLPAVLALHGRIGIEQEFKTSTSEWTAQDRGAAVQYSKGNGEPPIYFQIKVNGNHMLDVVGENDGKLEFVTVGKGLDENELYLAVDTIQALIQGDNKGFWRGKDKRTVQEVVKNKGLKRLFHGKTETCTITSTTVRYIQPGVWDCPSLVQTLGPHKTTRFTIEVEEGPDLVNPYPPGARAAFLERGIEAIGIFELQSNIDLPLRIFRVPNWPKLAVLQKAHEDDLAGQPGLDLGDLPTKDPYKAFLADLDCEKLADDAEKGFCGLVAMTYIQSKEFEADIAKLPTDLARNAATHRAKERRKLLVKISKKMIETGGAYNDPWVVTLTNKHAHLKTALNSLMEDSLSLKPVKVHDIDDNGAKVKCVVGELRSDRGVNSLVKYGDFKTLLSLIDQFWAIA